MKKNKGLIIGVIIVVIIIAVAAWYFFFRTPDMSKLGTDGTVDVPVPVPKPTPGPLDQYVCPPGTSGTPPDCVLDVVNQDTVFFNAIASAKQRVTNSASLNNIQKSNAISVIDVSVPNDKARILSDAATGKDLIVLILADAERIYLDKYGSPVVLISSIERKKLTESQNQTGSGGRN